MQKGQSKSRYAATQKFSGASGLTIAAVLTMAVGNASSDGACRNPLSCDAKTPIRLLFGGSARRQLVVEPEERRGRRAANRYRDQFAIRRDGDHAFVTARADRRE